MKQQNLKNIQQTFITELSNAQKGDHSSLPFIRHTLASHPIVANDEVFQVVVIGGSYYQKALMKNVSGNVRILTQDQGTQPPFMHEKTLMKFLAEHIDPHVKTVALNFAYPLHPVNREGRLDGRLVNGSKENSFKGLVGKVVGERIERYFYDKHNRQIAVSTANDTICLLLSGLMTHPWNILAAGVVGTGLNFAIFLDETTVVNLESAEFDRFEQSEAGKIIDASSVSPGSALIEKEISGAYLLHHFNINVKQQGIVLDKIRATKEIDLYARNKDEHIAGLARETLEHSASLVAAQISGILEFCKRDLLFIMQGSLYWKGYKYKETVARLVAELSPSYHASYEQVLHSDLFGAAKLVG
ncbi:MAG: hypothetical protein US54_C0002G0032 [Candidatus Roizmanbacteria bacterium GW2011_GWA2_37_7]|uniref:Hexokinase C-terminal domain-containing protein n=1 Tax=Candidatus Roizmanbacteria bacterium GW2011_GWA2_37_7 TaxID=1618481 RepID=A0A0G0JPL4_9BACT|nr:MAG: hypothetical protein US54_C0002G0032 [Candidatus Roizmanbacteria bacterium GW2011_GWA2_37_7]